MRISLLLLPSIPQPSEYHLSTSEPLDMTLTFTFCHQAATTIRSIVGCEEGLKRYVLCVEHDLAVLDYLSGTRSYHD